MNESVQKEITNAVSRSDTDGDEIERTKSWKAQPAPQPPRKNPEKERTNKNKGETYQKLVSTGRIRTQKLQFFMSFFFFGGGGLGHSVIL